jgi:outer membrane biosynthesis protein TonB
MRATLVSFILLGSAYALPSDAETDALQSKVDAYIDKVGQIVAQALMPELAKHRELGNVTKRFSFRIDAAGHPSEIKATSIPPSEFLDQLVIRVIRGLKFPRIPKEILEKYEHLEFRTEMGPPSSR